MAAASIKAQCPPGPPPPPPGDDFNQTLTYTLDACPASNATLDSMAAAISAAYITANATAASTVRGACEADVVTFALTYRGTAAIGTDFATCASSDPCAAGCLLTTCVAANDGGVNVNDVCVN